ncbi:MAG: substrate-binding domain-containing protein [Anaerolineaceae bacterium]|nr:substrate-binding domain-containing protein [Anaerolineaceae bacterium]MCB9101333.1 substrate-binding domain-containing protein [Anaerolineales bacterium]
MGKKHYSVWLVSLLFIVTACGGPGQNRAQPVLAGSIAVLLPDSASSMRWEADDRRFFERAFATAGVEYTIFNAEGNARTQQLQAEQAITNGAKVLLLTNLDNGSAATIIAQAHEAGVKVIDYDRITIEGPGADLHVSFDNVAVGRLMGETLQPLIDNLPVETPRVILLNGSSDDYIASLFAEGYKSVAEPKFEAGAWIKVDEASIFDWDTQQAYATFEQMLTAAQGHVDAVFAANDPIASAVVTVLKNQDHQPILLSGQDATVEGLQNILSGWQTMTVYKPIKLEADAAADAAIRMLAGEDVSAIANDTINNGQNDIPFMKLTPIAVTKDNIAETVIADGFRTWDEICIGEFEPYCPAENR